MNNWGKISHQFAAAHSRRQAARISAYRQQRRHRRALIDDEEVYGAGQHTIHTSFDGFCNEQRLRLEADLNRRVQRVRAAQTACLTEGWDDDIPHVRCRHTPCYRYQGVDYVPSPFAN